MGRAVNHAQTCSSECQLSLPCVCLSAFTFGVASRGLCACRPSARSVSSDEIARNTLCRQSMTVQPATVE